MKSFDSHAALPPNTPYIHDQAGSTSCYMLAGQASSMFARSCKRGISCHSLQVQTRPTDSRESVIKPTED